MDAWSPAQYRRFAQERRLHRAIAATVDELRGHFGRRLPTLASSENVLPKERDTPVRVALDDEQAYRAFLASYRARLERTLGPADRAYVFTFKRILMWARFDGTRPSP